MRYPIPRDVTTPCAADPSLFFAPNHREAEQEQTERVARARAVCAGCPWARGCLAYALHWAVEGVWGGTTLAEREQLRQRTGQVPKSLSSTPDGLVFAGGTEAAYQRYRRAEEHRRYVARRRMAGGAA